MILYKLISYFFPTILHQELIITQLSKIFNIIFYVHNTFHVPSLRGTYLYIFYMCDWTYMWGRYVYGTHLQIH